MKKSRKKRKGPKPVLANWRTSDQGKLLLQNSDIDTLRGKRNYAMLGMLIGYGLRRGELLALRTKSIQLREEHWVIADLIGKGGHIRTLPIPVWVKTAVDAWTAAVGNTQGRVLRSINKAAKVWGNGMTSKVLWELAREAASRAGIGKLAPHDLRRTCARLCHLPGGGLDQIQFLLGRVSIQTTERYLRCKQRLNCAVNDKLGIEPESGSRSRLFPPRVRASQITRLLKISGSITLAPGIGHPQRQFARQAPVETDLHRVVDPRTGAFPVTDAAVSQVQPHGVNPLSGTGPHHPRLPRVDVDRPHQAGRVRTTVSGAFRPRAVPKTLRDKARLTCQI